MTKRELYGTIGLRIRELRENAGITQDELAGIVGLTRTSITNIEKGIQKLGIDTLYDIAAVFGISGTALLPENHPNPGIADNYREIMELKQQQKTLEMKIKKLIGG